MPRITITIEDRPGGLLALRVDSDPGALGRGDAATPAQEVGLLLAERARQIMADAGAVVTAAEGGAGRHAPHCDLWYRGELEPGAACTCGADLC